VTVPISIVAITYGVVPQNRTVVPELVVAGENARIDNIGRGALAGRVVVHILSGTWFSMRSGTQTPS
jgi:hypothetical protein